MSKEIYLIAGLADETYESFTERILNLAKTVAKSDDIEQLKVTLTNQPPPKISIIPFKNKKVAALSVYKKQTITLTQLLQSAGFIGSYAVEEAIPVQYEKTWNDLSYTPGICLFTLFKQKEGISYDQFIDTWHNSHTPLSLKIHPLWNYNRNVVTEKLTDSTYNWDGIVEEQFKTVSELLNPIKFFGNPLVMLYRMWQVYADTKSFLDYKSIEPYFANEIYIKS
jgi:hypothetical protein